MSLRCAERCCQRARTLLFADAAAPMLLRAKRVYAAPCREDAAQFDVTPMITLRVYALTFMLPAMPYAMPARYVTRRSAILASLLLSAITPLFIDTLRAITLCRHCRYYRVAAAAAESYATALAVTLDY